MRPKDSFGSAELGRVNAQSWPLPEREIADAETVLAQIRVLIVQIEQTINQAKAHLAALDAAAPILRQALADAQSEKDIPPLADLKSARGLRAELVKAAQQSVAVSQSAARYLQARERFLLARRDWLKHTEKPEDVPAKPDDTH